MRFLTVFVSFRHFLTVFVSFRQVMSKTQPCLIGFNAILSKKEKNIKKYALDAAFVQRFMSNLNQDRFYYVSIA